MSPWSVQRRRRRRLARAAVLAAMALALVGVISSAQADANSDSATGIADGLRSFADRLDDSGDSLGEYQALAQSLPLVDLAPGSEKALRLSTLLQEQLTAGSKTLDATLQHTRRARVRPRGARRAAGRGAVHRRRRQHLRLARRRDRRRRPGQRRPPRRSASRLRGRDRFDGGRQDRNRPRAEHDTDLRLDTSGGAPAPATAFSVVRPARADDRPLRQCRRGDRVFTARFGFTDVKLSTDDWATARAIEKAEAQILREGHLQRPGPNGVMTNDECARHALTELATAELVDGDPPATTWTRSSSSTPRSSRATRTARSHSRT